MIVDTKQFDLNLKFANIIREMCNSSDLICACLDISNICKNTELLKKFVFILMKTLILLLGIKWESLLVFIPKI